MITLAGCSTRQRILVAGSKSMELMLELHRRGYLLAAAAGNCGAATGALDISIQSQVITCTMATGTISAGLASTVLATMTAALALAADADRADLELRLIKLLLKDRARVHPFAGNDG